MEHQKELNELLDHDDHIAWCASMRKKIEKNMRSTQRSQWFLLGTMGVTCLVCIVGIVLTVLLGG